MESRLSTLRTEILTFEQKFSAQRKTLHAEFQASASNLLHYIELRRHDLRELQEQLTLLGLSSLGRAEPDVLAGLNAVLSVLARLRHGGAEGDGSGMPAARSGLALGARHAEALLGPEPAGRRVRIMVTLPEEAAEEGALVRSLVAAGMESARINCAHGTAAEWKRMVEHVRGACAELRRPCKVLMDLGGPKLRTAALRPGPQVLRWRPERNELGQVISPARIWLSAPDSA
ncbi:MAG: pyruvate kinase, partial [SAR324 cluster bacterium]